MVIRGVLSNPSTPSSWVGYLSDFPGGIPGRSGLAGLGDDTTTTDESGATTSTWQNIWGAVSNPQTMTAVNSEGVFLINLQREMQGLPPLPANVSAPAFNVGLSGGTLLMIGVVALLAFGRG